jgi:hypothetical protein
MTDILIDSSGPRPSAIGGRTGRPDGIDAARPKRAAQALAG